MTAIKNIFKPNQQPKMTQVGGSMGLVDDFKTGKVVETIEINAQKTNSTVVITNLNADLLDGNHAAAFQIAGSYEPANANIQTHVTGTGSPHTAAGVGAAAASHTHLLAAGATDITATATEVNYTDGVTSAIQTQINGKQATLTTGDLTASLPLSLSATRQLIGGGTAITIGGLAGLGTANYFVGVNSGATAWEFKNIAGTSNQITATYSATLLTLSTPQDIHTSATPQFSRMGLGTAAHASIPLNISTGDNIGVQIVKSASGTAGLTVSGGYIYLLGGAFGFGTGDNNDFTLRANATEYGRVKTTGVWQMNAYGAGTATFDASGNISSVSDERLKNIQREFKRGIKEINKLNPFIFKWKPESNLETEKEYVGFSAQETKKLIPEAIGENKDGFLTFSDRAIIAALINSVKELNKRIEILEKK